MTKPQRGESATVTVKQAREIIGPDQISLNALYKAVSSGEVPTLRIGTRILIPREWLDRQLQGK